MSAEKTPMSEFERELVEKIYANTTFVPGTGPKRFIRECAKGKPLLTERGRNYLAFIAHRFRRQYQLSADQRAWVNERLNSAAEYPKLKDLWT